MIKIYETFFLSSRKPFENGSLQMNIMGRFIYIVCEAMKSGITSSKPSLFSLSCFYSSFFLVFYLNFLLSFFRSFFPEKMYSKSLFMDPFVRKTIYL